MKTFSPARIAFVAFCVLVLLYLILPILIIVFNNKKYQAMQNNHDRYYPDGVAATNKLYHGVVMLTGLAVIVTGVFMLSRVRTIFFPRNPYLFSDMTWGLMYVLHGLAGVGFITLVIVHVYFAVRPEKLPITASMIVGTMSREFYLQEHDPSRWVVDPLSDPRRGLADGD